MIAADGQWRTPSFSVPIACSSMQPAGRRRIRTTGSTPVSSGIPHQGSSSGRSAPDMVSSETSRIQAPHSTVANRCPAWCILPRRAHHALLILLVSAICLFSVALLRSICLCSTSAPVDPKAPNFHPVNAGKSASELFGELEPKDTEWTCPGGFAVETQVWYHVLDNGCHLMCQVIHSAVG